MLINPALTEEQNLLNEINTANATQHSLQTVSFSAPQVIEGVEPGTLSGKNTLVTVTALPASRYEGSDRIRYRRIHIPTQWAIVNNTSTIDYSGTVNETNMRAYIQTWFKFREESLVFNLEQQSENTYTLRISAKPNSYLYVGAITLTVRNTQVSLDVPNQLDGFSSPVAPSPGG